MRAPFLYNYEFFALDTDSEQDALYNEVVLFVTESRKATISSIQRQFKIGYKRATVIVETMAKKGIVSETDGTRIVLAPPPIK